MNNVIYQLVISEGEWDSYRETVSYADTSLERVREVRDELKRRSTEVAVANMHDGNYNIDDIYGWLAYRMEDGVTIRVERVALGGEPHMSNVTEVIDRDDWHMEMFENMSDEPLEMLDPVLNRYEDMAQEFEEKYS